MISKQAVEEQLKRIGCNFRFWGRAEVNELDRILMEDEVIAECVNGEYGNGFALLLATNHRLLLVDKKPLLYLTVEDLRYEMITEFNLHHRLWNATISIHTANKTLTFASWNQRRLRQLLEFIQGRVLEMRQQQYMAQQFQAAAAAQYAQVRVAQTQLPYVPAQQLFAQAVQSQPAERLQSTTSLSDPNDPSARQEASRQLRAQSRWTNGRAALGTYTRSRLPSLRKFGTPPTGVLIEPESDAA
jgi:hypothetical protein